MDRGRWFRHVSKRPEKADGQFRSTTAPAWLGDDKSRFVQAFWR